MQIDFLTRICLCRFLVLCVWKKVLFLFAFSSIMNLYNEKDLFVGVTIPRPVLPLSLVKRHNVVHKKGVGNEFL